MLRGFVPAEVLDRSGERLWVVGAQMERLVCDVPPVEAAIPAELPEISVVALSQKEQVVRLIEGSELDQAADSFMDPAAINNRRCA